MGSETVPVSATLRKRVLKVLFISLLLDLVRHSFGPQQTGSIPLTTRGLDIFYLYSPSFS